MFKNYFTKTFSLFIFIAIISLPFCVLAEGAGWDEESIENPLAANDFTTLVRDIIKWIVDIGLVIAVIMIIYAGFLYMISGGDETKITKARQTLTWALVGAGVLVIGEGFVYVLKNLLGVN